MSEVMEPEIRETGSATGPPEGARDHRAMNGWEQNICVRVSWEHLQERGHPREVHPLKPLPAPVDGVVEVPLEVVG